MRRSFLVLWALVAALACWRLDPATRPISGDNRLYFYLAERAASGVAPHVSLIDTKSQLGVLVTAAAIRTGRAAGIDDVVSSRAVSIACAATAVALAGELAALLTGSTPAGHVAALAMLASRGFADHAATGSNPKVFLAMFLLLAHVALARGATGRGVVQGSGGAAGSALARGWRGAADPASAPAGCDAVLAPARRRSTDVVAGLAAGAAFACWQPALVVVAAVGLEALAGKGGSIRRLVVVLLAALVPVSAYALYFAIHGALGVQLHQEYAMTLGSVHAPRRLVQSLAFVLTEARGTASLFRVGPLAFVIVAIVVLVRTLRDASWLLARPGALAVAAGGAAATAFTLYDHQGVPDLFFVAPYFAVSTGVFGALASAAVRASLASAGARASMASAGAVPAILAVLLLLQLAKDDSLRPRRGFTLADQRRIAEELHTVAATGDVWVYEAVHLLGLAHLDNHVAYGLFYDDVLSVLDVGAWRPVRDGRMPDVIVHARDRIPGSDAYLGPAYDEATPAGFAAQGLRLWKARAPVPAS